MGSVAGTKPGGCVSNVPFSRERSLIAAQSDEEESAKGHCQNGVSRASRAGLLSLLEMLAR